MANDEANPTLQPEAEDGPSAAIRVIVADSEPIFRVGVRKIVAARGRHPDRGAGGVGGKCADCGWPL